MEDMKEFPALLKPSEARPRLEPLLLGFLIKDAFKLRTLLVIGAVLQILLHALLPGSWAAVPALLLVLHSALTTLRQCLLPGSNPYAAGVVPGRTTAQLPSPTTALSGPAPASQPLVIFHFGVRFNHPLGILSPGALETFDRFRQMAIALSSDSDNNEEEDYGMLGMSRWRGGERDSHDTLMFVFYFRDVEGLRRFAHGPLHRDAWSWLAHSGLGHVAAFHEAFCVPAGGYETIYLDSAPVLLGAARARCRRQPDGRTVWASPLVSADAPALRTMSSRLDGSMCCQN